MAEWVDIAYGEAQRKLTEQRTARDTAGTRGLAVAGAGSATTAFMFSAALSGHDGWPWSAVVAFVCFVVAALAGVAVGFPFLFHDGVSGADLLGDRWMSQPEDLRLKHVVGHLSKYADDNKKPLALVHWALTLAYGALVFSVAAWALTLMTGDRSVHRQPATPTTSATTTTTSP